MVVTNRLLDTDLYYLPHKVKIYTETCTGVLVITAKFSKLKLVYDVMECPSSAVQP